MKKIVVFFILFVGCSPNSLEDFKHEGESICRDLTEDLRQIQSREELIKKAPRLKSHFERLVDLMIEAKKFQEIAEEEWIPLSTGASDTLCSELKRVYRLEAGRETIEKAQSEALLRLDAFERFQKKKQSKLK